MIPNLASAVSILLLWFSLEACAAPTDPPTPGLTMPLRMRSPASSRNLTELALLAKGQRDGVISKYFGQANRKRSNGYNLYVRLFWLAS